MKGRHECGCWQAEREDVRSPPGALFLPMWFPRIRRLDRARDGRTEANPHRIGRHRCGFRIVQGKGIVCMPNERLVRCAGVGRHMRFGWRDPRFTALIDGTEHGLKRNPVSKRRWPRPEQGLRNGACCVYRRVRFHHFCGPGAKCLGSQRDLCCDQYSFKDAPSSAMCELAITEANWAISVALVLFLRPTISAAPARWPITMASEAS